MATLQTLHDDITQFFRSSTLRLNTAQAELETAARFAKSPIVNAESPLDKPLPPLPTPVDFEIPIVRITSPSIREPKYRKAPIYEDPNELWHQHYVKSSAEGGWVDSLFAGNDIHFGAVQGGYAWKLGRRVTETVHFNPKHSYATAVYECSQIKGRVRGPRAYIKIYMQIPCYCPTCERTCAKPLPMPKELVNEIAALKRMSQIPGEVSAPRLLAMKIKEQSRKMWVAGGFLTFIVMQRLPGVTLNSDPFWRLPSKIRNEIRMSFKRCLLNVWRAGVLPRKCAIDKIAWDSVTKKCHIVDLEGAEIAQNPIQWWDYELYRWGLSRSSFELSGTPIYETVSNPADYVNQKISMALKHAESKATFELESPPTIRYELASPDLGTASYVTGASSIQFEGIHVGSPVYPN